MLTEIKPPGPAQVTEVGTALQAVFTAQGLTEEDVAKRQDIVSTMQALLLSVLPGEPPGQIRWRATFSVLCGGEIKWNGYVILAVIISPQLLCNTSCKCNKKLFPLSLSLSLALCVVEIQLRLYGSSCTKFGFKDADINIDILYPLHVSGATLSDRVFFFGVCFLGGGNL